RKLDPQRSIEYLPYYPHEELLEPGEIYEVDLEIWPMGLALPAGSRLTLTIQGKDFERLGATGPLRGVAWFTHDDPDRSSLRIIRRHEFDLYRRPASILSFATNATFAIDTDAWRFVASGHPFDTCR